MAGKDKDDGETGMTGRRKKTWRELDAGRGKSRYSSRQDDPGQQRLEQSATYEKYKQAADSLFTGGELPQGLAETFDPSGKRKEQKTAFSKLAQAPDRKAWASMVVEYLEKYPELPEDLYFLDSLLDHPKDRLVDKALAKLELLQADGKLTKEKTPRSLEQRLRALEMTSMDDEVKTRAKAMRSKL